MAEVFTANVYTRNPETGENQLFKIGDEVPDWAYEGDHAMGAHVFGQGVTSPVENAPRSDTGVDPASFTPDSADAEGAFKSEAPTVEKVEVVAEEEEEAPESYEDWTKDDLKAEAKGRGLSGYSSLSKEELISLLEEDDEAHAEEEDDE